VIEDATSGPEIILIVLIAVPGILAALAAQVARSRGASRSETLNASAIGAGLGLVLCSFAPLVGVVALVVVSVFLAVWLNLFLLVRRLKHRRRYR
jgi:Flp pilus assembly protein TadB